MSKWGIWALTLLATTACGDDTPNGPSGETMQVRLVNANSGTADLELVVDGEVVLADVGTGEVSAFATITADAPEIVLRRKFGSFMQPIPFLPVADGLFAVTAMGDNNVVYTSVAVVAEADTGKAVAGRANLRAINLSSASPAPEIDIHVTAPNAPLGTATVAWQMNSVLAQYSGLRDFPPGPLQVRITLKGSTTVVAASPVLAVGADEIRVITLRHAGGNTFEIVIAVEQGQ